MNRPHTALVLTLAWLVLQAGSAGAADPPLPEGYERYTDPIQGYALAVPPGAVRQSSIGTDQTVTWVLRDKRTEAILWTIEVKTVYYTGEKELDLKEYAERLRDELAKREKTEVSRVAATRAAGKPAIVAEGVNAVSKLWERQVWIRVAGERFLVLSVASPSAERATASEALEEMLETLRVFDPAEHGRRLKAYLDRGATWLDSIPERTIRNAVEPERRWMWILSEGEIVGWHSTREMLHRREGVDGVRVVSTSFAQAGQQPPVLGLNDAFSGLDGSVDAWAEYLQVGSGDEATSLSRSVLVKDRLALGVSYRNGRQLGTRRRNDIPDQWYLPRATGHLLWRLMDVSRPSVCAFVTFDESLNRCQMRTVTVTGKRTQATSPDGDALVGWAIVNQEHWDKPPTTLVVDSDRRLLEVRSEGSPVMRAVGRDAVLRKYPKAMRIIEAMERKSQLAEPKR
jgi:hypothetical protein